MKRIVLSLTIVCLLAVIGLYTAQRRPGPAHNTAAPAEAARDSELSPEESSPRYSPQAGAANTDEAATGQPSASPSKISRPAIASSPSPSLPFQQALSTLVSVQAGFAQKQAAWQQLRETGMLDHAIADLEQRSASDPATAEYPAVLGQAYLQKAGTVTDVREQGILGMKADQSFDAALNLDPSNWEAGFWKAAALSYWPPQLGKSTEVMERFVALIKLQENQQPQPQFAQTYVMLGDQYHKQGYPEQAAQIWQRGATLFPNDATLAQKLSPPSQEQAVTR